MNLNLEFMEWLLKKNLFLTIQEMEIFTFISCSIVPLWHKSVQFRENLLWNNLPRIFKESVSVEEFKHKLNYIQKIHCSCVACRRFLNFSLFCKY